VIRAYGDGRLFGYQHGDTPTVLALHGWRRDHRDFLPALGSSPVIALDLPGFGRSAPPDGPWGAARYAEAVRPVLDAMDGPVLVVGHSFGGRVAVVLAADHPEAVGALVLTGVPLLHRAGRRATPPAPFRAARWLHRRGLLPDARMEALRLRYGSEDYRAAEGVMREVFVTVVNESYEEQLAALTCPVHLLWGEEDDQVPPEVASRAEAMLAHATLSIAGEVGHLLPLEAPATLRDAVQRSVAAVATRCSP
jgi:pimeloyl-ACP methyl ester carboxylesterase